MLFRIEEHDQVSSTNDIIKQAIDFGEAEGLCVSAHVQTSGYGRQGRMWTSPQGGMYVSALLRPHASLELLPTLSLVAGVAVRRALAGLVDDSIACAIKLKWPNDIVLVRKDDAGFGRDGDSADSDDACSNMSFDKLCGISLERHLQAICLGIGVNVFDAADGADGEDGKDGADGADGVRTDGDRTDDDARNIPVYLAELAGWNVGDPSDEERWDTIQRVRDSVLKSFFDCYVEWLENGFEPFRQEYNDHLALRSCHLQISDNKGNITDEGISLGVDEVGRLLLETADNAIMRVSSGEAHVATASRA